MRKLLFIFLIFATINIFPCTTFVLDKGDNFVFGRNLDWVSDNGLLIINKRNQKKKSLVFSPDKAVEWTSKYGSITFNQFGKEFPFGGINEKGLVVEIMNSYAEFPQPDSRGAVNELQWVQYQLDNAKTVDEVIESENLIRIRKISQNLHFLIADKNGDVAVIEFFNGKMKVYKGKNLPILVLENDTYSKSLKRYNNKEDCRFYKASKMLENYNEKENAVDYSFKILDNVKLDGSWSVVYDIKNMKIYFKTASNKNIKNIEISNLSFACETEELMYDLQLNDKGGINDKLKKFDSKTNTFKMKDAMIKNNIALPEEIKKMFYNYHKTIVCKK